MSKKHDSSTKIFTREFFVIDYYIFIAIYCARFFFSSGLLSINNDAFGRRCNETFLSFRQFKHPCLPTSCVHKNTSTNHYVLIF